MSDKQQIGDDFSLLHDLLKETWSTPTYRPDIIEDTDNDVGEHLLEKVIDDDEYEEIETPVIIAKEDIQEEIEERIKKAKKAKTEKSTGLGSSDSILEDMIEHQEKKSKEPITQPTDDAKKPPVLSDDAPKIEIDPLEQLNDSLDLGNNDYDNPPPAVDTHTKKRRQEIFAKWGIHYYNIFQGSISILGYKVGSNRKRLVAREDELMKRVYAGKNTKADNEELESLRELIKSSDKNEAIFQANAFMPDDLIKDTQEMFTEVAEVEDININPMLLLALLLLITPTINVVQIFIDRYNNNKIIKKSKNGNR